MTDTIRHHRIERFLAYAAAFESAFATDDWTVLEPFFTEDATSELDGSLSEGRQSVLGSFQNACDLFDRRFDRRALRLSHGPELDGDAVHTKVTATYDREGLPTLELRGEEWFHFEGDRIKRHVDHVLNRDEIMSYLGRHMARLRPPPQR